MWFVRRYLTGSFLGLLIGWALISWCVWLYAGLISLWIQPHSQVSLPWVDLNDFVETPDGRVFIDLPFQHRIGCFDRRGHLIAYYPSPLPGKDTELAVGRNGYVYYRQRNSVHTLTSTWETLAATRRDNAANRTWELADDWQPRYAPDRKDETPHDRPVVPGEVLFSDARAWDPVPQREHFHCSDGSTLWRKSLSLERKAPTGEVVAVYGPPWYVRPFGLWGFASLCILALIAVLSEMFRPRKPPDLVINADGSLCFQGESVSLTELAEKLNSLPAVQPDGQPAAISIVRNYNPDRPPAQAVEAIERAIRTGRYIDTRNDARRMTEENHPTPI
jgi:hypothetical protein